MREFGFNLLEEGKPMENIERVKGTVPGITASLRNTAPKNPVFKISFKCKMLTCEFELDFTTRRHHSLVEPHSANEKNEAQRS